MNRSMLAGTAISLAALAGCTTAPTGETIVTGSEIANPQLVEGVARLLGTEGESLANFDRRMMMTAAGDLELHGVGLHEIGRVGRVFESHHCAAISAACGGPAQT